MPASGGAELSIYSTLKLLTAYGYRVIVITSINETEYDFDDNADSSFIIIRIATVTELDQTVDDVVSRFPDVFVCMTQNLWSDHAILAAKRHGIPTLYILRSPFGNLDISPGGPYACTHVLANSPATKEYLERHYGLRDVKVIPPVVNYKDYVVTDNTREFITMINPIEIKGGCIFKEIALRLADRKFLAVLGWGHLKRNGQWHTGRLKELAESYRAELYIPNEVDFTDIPNVLIQPTVSDMRVVYGRTRLLLIPSISSESSPRVGYEAMINGIPVIGSAVGGIGFVLGRGGVTIEDYRNIDAWVHTIQQFDDPDYYASFAQSARERAKEEDSAANIKPLLEILAGIQGQT